jgi:hypothetical protein
MILKNLAQKLAIAGLAVGAFTQAHAVPVTFDLSGSTSSVSVESDCWGRCGVNATLNPLLGSVADTLDVGQSFDFDFFNLNFWGTGIGSGSISASLGFDQPTGSPNADGTGSGGFLTLFGRLSGGYLTWDTFSPITLADGTSFLVEFEDLVGIDFGSVTVGGRISLLSNAASVPEPGTLGLFGLSMLAMGFAARRRRMK